MPRINASSLINREGVKLNRNRKEGDDFVTSDNTSEAHKVIHDADNVFVLNKSMHDEMNNKMYLVLDKSRTGPKNIVYELKTDFARATTHDKSLGYKVYSGEDNRMNGRSLTNQQEMNIVKKAIIESTNGR